jgi:pre-rRNA-processing protein SRD1
MANPMNNFDLEYSAATHDDDSPDAREGVSSQLRSSLSDPSLMGYPNSHVASYPFADMLPQDFDSTLQSFDQNPRAQGELEGRLSNVMLAYDAPTTGVSMTMGLDSSGAFAFDIPTTYPATTLDLVPSMDDSQLQSAFSFHQSMSQEGQYMSQQQAPAPPPQQARRDPYNGHATNTTTTSTETFEDSDFSRNSDRSQPLNLGPVQESRRFPSYGQTQQTGPAPYRGSQPVAIQPKKPIAAVKGELPSCSVSC